MLHLAHRAIPAGRAPQANRPGSPSYNPACRFSSLKSPSQIACRLNVASGISLRKRRQTPEPRRTTTLVTGCDRRPRTSRAISAVMLGDSLIGVVFPSRAVMVIRRGCGPWDIGRWGTSLAPRRRSWAAEWRARSGRPGQPGPGVRRRRCPVACPAPERAVPRTSPPANSLSTGSAHLTSGELAIDRQRRAGDPALGCGGRPPEWADGPGPVLVAGEVDPQLQVRLLRPVLLPCLAGQLPLVALPALVPPALDQLAQEAAQRQNPTAGQQCHSGVHGPESGRRAGHSAVGEPHKGLCVVNRGRPSRADPALDILPRAASPRARRNGGHRSQGAGRQSRPRAHTRLPALIAGVHERELSDGGLRGCARRAVFAHSSP
jgi:hypothetical protein